MAIKIIVHAFLTNARSSLACLLKVKSLVTTVAVVGP
jgi:hypothetical protein